MVGIVVVSHSRELANAVVNLARQVSGAEVPMAIAAGVGDERQEFGTDAIELMEAIQSVFSDSGVLVLMDLGSAVLSAETALDFLDPEMREKVRLCPGPLVEGLISAAVQAGLGSNLEEICLEASNALFPKMEQLGAIGPTAGLAVSEELKEDEAEEIHLRVLNLHGLHARPAARFVKAAAGFQADIQVLNLTNSKGPVSAKSLNALATLGAVKGSEIVIRANGPDATQALSVLSEMVKEGFGELEQEEISLPGVREPSLVAQSGEGFVQAVPVSEGVAIGPFFRYQPPLPQISDALVEDIHREWQRFKEALQTTQVAIRQRRKQLAPSLGEAQAAIFDAHELILQDPELLDATYKKIQTEKLNAAAAWNETIMHTADTYRNLDDLYLKQRAIDVVDVGNQVLFALAGDQLDQKIELQEPVILFAQELTPTETSQLDMGKVMGILTAGGGPTSHSAILARALGIPAVAGVGIGLENLTDQTILGVNGFSGQVWIRPSEEVYDELEKMRGDWLEEKARLKQSSQVLAMTEDGHRVEVVANVGNVLDAQSAAENGAEGIGLLRTEFLFLTSEIAPTEEEQFDMLCQIGYALNRGGISEETQGGWPMIVRTLDIGGDKEVPYIQLAPEANPFLGVRALRLSLRKPDLFLPQLKAILRAGKYFNFRIMYPMVANLEEIIQARNCLEQAHQDLLKKSIPHRWPVESGIMIEIPSAALCSEILAPQVDFFSIGTNDLTQYTLAAERGNPELAGLADALHPAILRLIKHTANGAHQYGKWTGVCGELAGDPYAIPILVGLGVDELSMNPGSIPRAKAILRVIQKPQAEALAETVLKATSAKEVRKISQDFYDQNIRDRIS